MCLGRSRFLNIMIRSMTRNDAPTVHRMMKELARFEGVSDYPQFSVDELIKDGFETSPPWYRGLVASGSDDELCGYAIYNRAYSTWTRAAFYLEDLYVAPDMRSVGVAPLLMQRLSQIALEEGVNSLDGQVLESNTAARAFYERLGARDLRLTQGRSAMRLHRDRLEAIARGVSAHTSGLRAFDRSDPNSTVSNTYARNLEKNRINNYLS